MGMFDYVNFECDCPVCDSKLGGFQSKSGDCLFSTLEPHTVNNFYSYCDNCSSRVEYYKESQNSYRREVEQKREVLREFTKSIKITNPKSDDLFFVLDTLHYSLSVTQANEDDTYYKQAGEAMEKLSRLLHDEGYRR